MRSCMILLLTKYCLGFQVKEGEMDVACMGEKRNAYRVFMTNLKE
jgi:hypothetical protein